MIDIRVRSQISDIEMGEKVGKILTSSDYNVLLTGPTRVQKPDGRLLCVYLPEQLRFTTTAEAYPILHGFRGITTDNRGLASGSIRFRPPGSKRTRSALIRSTIIGAFDPAGSRQFCRLSTWTGKETEQMKALYPMFQEIADNFRKYVPDRYAQQMQRVKDTHPEWVIPKTPFTTVTVNNTYPTGVHKDKGDLDEGFSALAVIRRGKYTGGYLTFPRFRIAVDMQDSDLLLMDAHDWHGNTKMDLLSDDAERISVVCYYRTRMVECGTDMDEFQKAQKWSERHVGIEVGQE